MNQVDLLTIGDANLDVFVTPLESETSCKLDTKECFICFGYGDKIPVKNLEFCVGGNAANNAVGVTRLGVKSQLVLTLGDDNVGKMISENLAKEGLDLTYIFQQTSTASNYNTIINYSGERTIFTYHAPRSYEFPTVFPKAAWVYLTSMGESFRPFYNHMIDWFRKNPEVKVAFNPGSWQLRSLDCPEIQEVLKLTTLLYVNRQEAQKISKFGDSFGKEKDLLKAVCAQGPKMAIITDGSGGSYSFGARLDSASSAYGSTKSAFGQTQSARQGQKFLKCGVLPVDAYERTGAGDSFGSGCLSAIIKGKPLEEALLWGTVNSASVIGYVGSMKGLLRDSEMPVWLERARSSGVKVEEF